MGAEAVSQWEGGGTRSAGHSHTPQPARGLAAPVIPDENMHPQTLSRAEMTYLSAPPKS